MADQTLAFAPSPVVEGEQTAFIETALLSGETTVELDLAGGVRLAAIAFEAGFAGASIVVSVHVPWTASPGDLPINGLTISVAAGEVVPLPFVDAFWPGKVLLTVNTGQSATKKIGFFGWRSQIQ
jgi:hypothetical protein